MSIHSTIFERAKGAGGRLVSFLAPSSEDPPIRPSRRQLTGARIRYHDPNPDFALCVSAQKYFEHHHFNTKVLAASFSSTDDIMKLAGIHHMTVPPHLLEQLFNTPASAPKPTSLFQGDSGELPDVSLMFLYHREFFLKATERGHHKLSQVSSFHCSMYAMISDVLSGD